MPRHFFERDAFGGFRITDNLTRVVVGDEAFRDQVKEHDGYGKQNSADHDRERAMLQHHLKRPAIATNQPFVGLLSLLPPGSFGGFDSITFLSRLDRVFLLRLAGRQRLKVMIVSMSSNHFQQPAAKHRRQAQRYKARHQNGNADGDCEFTKQPAENSTQKQHGYEYRN